ncbi:hypothetical protein [Aliiruegeria haliotis]|uniref:hypothetical protein n=1 Tax=Aliiruegeria haliotis TaxID=1280846 RepID=UPI0011B248FA|nr:hypothetical protein [Aliiruegeria haliotis]
MTNSTDELKPVTMWENKAAKGHALCAEPIFRDHIEGTQALRDRQAAYLDSLPSDPPEVIRAALKLMHPNSESYPDGIEEALHLSHALEALVKDGDLDEDGFNRDAALYVADRVVMAMHRATRQLDRIGDILGNPGRIERDRAT